MSKLLKLQGEFTKAVSRLLELACEDNALVTIGEVYRTDAQAELNAKLGVGIRNSLHRLSLAIDIRLFREDNGVYKYLTDSEDYRTLGEWWEGQHPLARWGGRFSKPDGGHFSFEWKGVR